MTYSILAFAGEAVAVSVEARFVRWVGTLNIIYTSIKRSRAVFEMTPIRRFASFPILDIVK